MSKPRIGKNFAITLLVTITKRTVPQKEFLLAIHELVEKALCKNLGIPDSVIDDFDKGSDKDEPGEDPKCPYREMHFTAETVERLMADLMGIDWLEYCESLEGKR